MGRDIHGDQGSGGLGVPPWPTRAGGSAVVLKLEDPNEADAQAIERFQAGDRAAFEELHDRHRDRLYRYCRYRLGNHEEAEDVVQEAFARAWTHLPTFAGDKRFYAWMRVVAGNLCTDVLRRRGRTEVRAEVDPGSESEGHEDLYRSMDAALVRSAIRRLKPRHRDALELQAWREMSYQEIASHVGVSINTVESLLWRARQALKRELAAVSGGEGLLCCVPGVGWMVRRLRTLRHMASAGGAAPAGTAGLIAVGAVVAGVVAASLFVGGALGSPAPVPGSVGSPGRAAPVFVNVSSATGAPAPTAPTGTVPTSAGLEKTAASAASVPAHPARVGLRDPVVVNGAAARTEAQSDPLQVTVPMPLPGGGAYLGADPSYVVGYVASHVAGVSSATNHLIPNPDRSPR